MKIDNIQIKNYRKFKKMVIDFNPRMNVIIGNNGVGNTSNYIILWYRSLMGTET